MIWYDMIWYDVMWYDVIWYDMIWYDICITYIEYKLVLCGFYMSFVTKENGIDLSLPNQYSLSL